MCAVQVSNLVFDAPNPYKDLRRLDAKERGIRFNVQRAPMIFQEVGGLPEGTSLWRRDPLAPTI